LLEGEGIVVLLLFLFWVWALFDCISTDAASCRNLPKGAWLILVFALPDVGSLAWLLLGRPEKAGWKPGSQRSGRRPMGLEDHPHFSGTSDVSDRRSAELDARLDQWEREQSAQRELEVRERELRQREDELGE
jgi:hypothetical protein